MDLHFWRDVNDIEPDGVFEREIRAALEQAMFMVAVLSPNYILRKWCLRELGDFINFPPGVDPTPLPAELQLAILWQEILKRDLRIEVVGPVERTASNFVHGITSLPVRVSARR